jgi:DNA-binding CsgD family transcriptional regulator
MPQLVCPAVIGREAEMGRIEAALDAARDGAGGMTIVSGEAGIGKSRLARAASDHAREREMRVLVGRAVNTSAPIPYRPFAEALQAGFRDPDVIDEPTLDPYRVVLRRLLPEAAHDVSEGASPLALMEGVLRLLGAIGSSGGALLVLEDIHWADSDTLALIEYLADHLPSTSTLCLCTERTDSPGESIEVAAILAARRAVERLALEPLSDDSVEAMTRATLEVDEIPLVLVEALRARASGVPFLVEEMLSAYLAAGGPAKRQPEWWMSRRIADGLPPSYREVVRERLGSLDEDTRTVVAAAAVIGRASDWRLLAATVDSDERAVLDRLRAAVRARLLGSQGDHFAVFEFRHALAREAVMAELSPGERTELSLRAAHAIEAVHPGLPGEWCQRAADLLEEGGDRLGAMGRLQEAARRALARSAFESAEQTLVRARELAGDDWMAWMGVDDLLLEVFSRAGKTERVLELGNQLVEAHLGRYRNAPRVAGIHLRIARGVAPSGDWTEVTKHLDAARDTAETQGDSAVLAGTDALSAHAALALGDPARARKLAANAARAADELHLWDVLCEALDAEGRAAFRDGQLKSGVDAFNRLARAADDHHLPAWRVRALLELGALDQLRAAELGRLLEARELAAAIGAVFGLAAADLQIAWGHLGRAELDQAREAIGRSIDLSRSHRLGMLATALTARCMLNALAGEDTEMESAAGEALVARQDLAVRAAVAGNGRAVLSLVRGDEPAALEHLEAAAADIKAAAPREWSVSWLVGLRALLRAAHRLEQTEDGASPPDPLSAGYVALASAIVLGRSGRGGDAKAAVSSALTVMAPGWRRAHAQLVVARCAFEDGWGEPSQWMREALTFLDSVPLAQLAAACKAVLRRAGAPVPRRGRGESQVPPKLKEQGVTSREMDVLHLVAERFSNKEIGERLFLSPRTIEGHVATLLRKLDLERRADLVQLGRSHGTQRQEQADT